MSMVLVRPEHDVFAPGEHNGTFRGHMPAFVTATAALDRWTDTALTDKVIRDGGRVREGLERLGGAVRGRGLIWGLDVGSGDRATAVSREAFRRGLILETCGPRDEVLKVLPPLTIEASVLAEGLQILAQSLRQVDGRGPVLVPVGPEVVA